MRAGELAGGESLAAQAVARGSDGEVRQHHSTTFGTAK
jgi:hypothetical protein